MTTKTKSKSSTKLFNLIYASLSFSHNKLKGSFNAVIIIVLYIKEKINGMVIKYAI